jgi:hypothetical protein
MRSFNDRSEPISINSLQGSILLSYTCFVEGQHHQEALLAAQAVCMVQIFRLPSALVENSILRETQIRRRFPNPAPEISRPSLRSS